MSKTHGDYGSDVTRPKINTNTHFELKGQFLKELRDNTFSGSEYEDANEHFEKVLEAVDLFHIPNITKNQIMLRAFPVSLTRAASRWLRNEPAGLILTWEERFEELLMKCTQHYLTDMQEIILFYNGLDVPARQILDSKGAIPTKTAANAKAQLNSLGREIKKVNEKVYDAQVGCELCKGPNYTQKPFHSKKKRINPLRSLPIIAVCKETRGELKHNQRRFDLLPDAKLSEIKGASIKTLEIQIGQMSKVLQERGLKSTQLDGNEPKGSCQIILTAKAISNGYVVSDQAHKPVADSQIRNVFSETVLFF
ncbi:hypothetical protein Tco_1370796 [Tanacetum coccineum]|uniref:Retrotransposon gag domain-containing protein n=1 Tax=Tanacetum coccineum TaxID=301880 RepID=A0ABQ5I632_9ASTR